MISELVRAVDVMLSDQVNDCESFGGTRDRLTIANLVDAVGSALHGCQVQTVDTTTGG